jgi:hypothetical protein
MRCGRRAGCLTLSPGPRGNGLLFLMASSIGGPGQGNAAVWPPARFLAARAGSRTRICREEDFAGYGYSGSVAVAP